MKRKDFIIMQLQDIEALPDNKKATLADVVDCFDLALSQMGTSFEVDAHKTAVEAYEKLGKYVSENKLNSLGPFTAIEKVFAPYLGATYRRPTSLYQEPENIDLMNFL